MKAIILKEVGGPENLILADVPVPSIKENEVLVQVKAVAINPVDAFVRRNQAALEMIYALKGNEENIILGWDVAGIVTQVGSTVTRFQVGDEVFGNFNFIGQANAYSEFVAAPEHELVIKPENVSFEEAAGATMAALTAWASVVKLAKVKKGDKVIVYGASGGVGHYAVQIAKHFGAYVVGVASGDNKDFVLGLGADEFFDYKTQAVEDFINDADIVHDAVWVEADVNSTEETHLARSLKTLKDGGILSSIVVYPDQQFIDKAKTERNITVQRVNVTPNDTYLKDMETIAQLLSEGEIKTYTSHVFPLAEMAKAHEIIQTKNAVGKIILVP
ncbi:NADP-dependent oxidoreductase [Chryseobacterium balustinum]|uniref:NADPH:quinone reductase n=1 Tax=Chryseobacterium balustinum TaxID=246 RepID=A0AAX2IP44_9FLAO|nr:NADP-dependent oxidoreductase [Chryseobacterium balustinum]AZB29826.1 NADP-dependent oxidoreductase [Chryseobacterium balustinum]SKB95483.1 NADPH:quinone reductase [Chryseobacterium balustinum]SQA90203.1 Quinone oxidoreductase 1 [Chryseobacterium balustinum]